MRIVVTTDTGRHSFENVQYFSVFAGTIYVLTHDAQKYTSISIKQVINVVIEFTKGE